MGNETEKALIGLLDVPNNYDHFDVIVGMNNPNIESLTEVVARNSHRVELHIQVSNMMDYFAKSYLYVGAVGATTWERCALALPGLVCSVADNQINVAEDLDKINGHSYLGSFTSTTSKMYKERYYSIRNNLDKALQQSEKCAVLVDGLGTISVVKKLEAYPNENM